MIYGFFNTFRVLYVLFVENMRMKTILFIAYCLYLSVYSREDYDCQVYMKGDVNSSSISYVENLELRETVTVFFRDDSPCHELRYWYAGFKKLRSFNEESESNHNQTDNSFCINYLNLTQENVIEMDLLSPNNDVIFSQVGLDYSSVRPICVKNRTAHYIKLQRVSSDPLLSKSCTSYSIVSTHIVPAPSPCSNSRTTTVTTTIISGQLNTTMSCMMYILPSLSTTTGVLIAIIAFLVIAMLVKIRCKKYTQKNSKRDEGVHTHNPVFEHEDCEED